MRQKKKKKARKGQFDNREGKKRHQMTLCAMTNYESRMKKHRRAGHKEGYINLISVLRYSLMPLAQHISTACQPFTRLAVLVPESRPPGIHHKSNPPARKGVMANYQE